MTLKAKKLIPAIATLYLLSLLALTPNAAAQNTPMTVNIAYVGDSDTKCLIQGRITPESCQVKIHFQTTVTAQTGSECIALVTVRYTPIYQTAWSLATVSPAVDSKALTYKTQGTGAPFVGEQGTAIFEADLYIQVKRNAPAMEAGQYKVKADASVGGATGCTNTNPGTNEGSPYTLLNDYFPIMQYLPDTQIVKSGQNKRVNFGVKMTNFGNGPTKIAVDVTEDSPKKRLDAVLVPGEQKLESKPTQGANAKFETTIVIQAQTPHGNGYTNTFYGLKTRFTASFDGVIKDGAENVQSFPLSVQVQGVYVPGFDSVSIFAGIGLALAFFGTARRFH